MSSAPTATPVWHLYVPKLYTVLRRGYRADDFRHDLVAGLTVAIVALPLVPLIDAAGVTALRLVLQRCARAGTRVILSGLREQPRAILTQTGVSPESVHL
jgi:MFS superfamily sulfate permease-like transporter